MSKKKLSKRVATIVVVMFAVIVTACVTFVTAQKAKWYSPSLFAQSIEALADGEGPVGIYEGDYVSYTFNGQTWWGNPNGNGNWFPTYDTCRLDGNDGHQVHCTQGDGNCWNGTSCIKD